jgi:predicted nuclease of predicted toxin-antitoxin system
MTAVRFLLDEHISPEIAIELRRVGIECLTVGELGRLGLSDESHLDWAFDNHYVTVTFDRDFLRLNATGVLHAGIVYFGHGQYGADVVTPALRQLHSEASMEHLQGAVRFL